MKKDEALKKYEEALAKIDKQAHEAHKVAKATLHKRLKALQTTHHQELKAIRVIQQRTKSGG